MRKYDRLERYLSGTANSPLKLAFRGIEEIIEARFLSQPELIERGGPMTGRMFRRLRGYPRIAG